MNLNSSNRVLHPSLSGIILMVVGVMVLPVTDAATKLLAERYSIFQLLGLRFVFPLALILPLCWWRHGRGGFVVRRPSLLIGRGILWVGVNICFAASIRVVPLADGIAVVFFGSVVLIVLSRFLLRENVSGNRWLAVGLGLVAIMIIIRPGFNEFKPAMLYALVAAVFYGCYLFSNRLLGEEESILVVMIYQLLGALVVLIPIMMLLWVTPSVDELMIIVGASLVNVAGHLLIIKAFQMAEASLLAPFVYAEIIMHVVLGATLFGDFPDGWTWIGIGLMICVGIQVSISDPWLREGKN